MCEQHHSFFAVDHADTSPCISSSLPSSSDPCTLPLWASAAVNSSLDNQPLPSTSASRSTSRVFSDSVDFCASSSSRVTRRFESASVLSHSAMIAAWMRASCCVLAQTYRGAATRATGPAAPPIPPATPTAAPAVAAAAPAAPASAPPEADACAAAPTVVGDDEAAEDWEELLCAECRMCWVVACWDSAAAVCAAVCGAPVVWTKLAMISSSMSWTDVLPFMVRKT
mmetsp:Transcript_18836/g.47226  ORF Transcript_18836/g.47226 Transcript_18836/m.47226 type:complete len:226 (-) Transcript_18836:434-1111(-)